MRLDRRLLRTPAVQTGLGWLLGRYARLNYDTARLVFEPANAYDRLRDLAPAILVFWHGMALMCAGTRPLDLPATLMVARNPGASVGARAAESQGVPTIRASGAHSASAALRKGGASGFRQALAALEDGRSVLMTADVPKVSRVAGRGSLLLARASGRPIVPVAYVSQRAIRLGTWDRLAIDLPFSRAAVVHGEPLRVPEDADDAAIDALRLRLSTELDRVGERAYQIAGCPGNRRNGPAPHG